VPRLSALSPEVIIIEREAGEKTHPSRKWKIQLTKRQRQSVGKTLRGIGYLPAFVVKSENYIQNKSQIHPEKKL